MDPNVKDTGRELGDDCEGCHPLLLERFHQPKPYPRFGGLIDFYRHTTRYEQIASAARHGCVSCSVIDRAIQHFSNHQPSESAIELRCREEIDSPGLNIGFKDSEGKEIEVQLFSAPGAAPPWPAVGSGQYRDIAHHPSSPAVMDLARLWINECCNDHFPPYRPAPLPTRVLHVGSDDVEPRLYTSQGEEKRYAALSHRWGATVRPLTTETATLGQRTQEIPFRELPKTFRDAVTVTRSLGIDYLWIDSLCIIQDDPKDWEREALKMADVYSNSFVTLSADDAEDATQGFLIPRDGRANLAVSIAYPASASSQGAGHVYARRKAQLDAGDKGDGSSFDIAHTPDGVNPVRLLDTRGWTFQERLLAPRTLHFTAAEMVFECTVGVKCECTLVRDDKLDRENMGYQRRLFKRHHTLSHTSGSDPPPMYNWAAVVDGYTSRVLTYDKDRLPAIAGVATAMHPFPPEDYYFGLWSKQLKWSLLWTAATGAVSRRHSPPEYAPTWSWASVISPISHSGLPYNNSFINDPITFRGAEIVNVDTQRDANNPFGPGRGSITLEALVGEATVCRSPSGASLVCRGARKAIERRVPLRPSQLNAPPDPYYAVGDFSFDFFPDVTDPAEPEVADKDTVPFAIILSSIFTKVWIGGIVLNPAPVAGLGDGAPPVYRRVGAFFCEDGERFDKSLCNRKTIKII